MLANVINQNIYLDLCLNMRYLTGSLPEHLIVNYGTT